MGTGISSRPETYGFTLACHTETKRGEEENTTAAQRVLEGKLRINSLSTLDEVDGFKAGSGTHTQTQRKTHTHTLTHRGSQIHTQIQHTVVDKQTYKKIDKRVNTNPGLPIHTLTTMCECVFACRAQIFLTFLSVSALFSVFLLPTPSVLTHSI